MPPRRHWGPRNPPGRAPSSHLGALIDVPSGPFGPTCCHLGPCRSTLWPIRGSALFGALIALPFGHFGAYRSTLWSIWADLLPFRPLSLYPLAMSALSYVPFVSVPCWAHCCRTLSKFSNLATYPLGLGGESLCLPPRGLVLVFFLGKEFAFSTSSRV